MEHLEILLMKMNYFRFEIIYVYTLIYYNSVTCYFENMFSLKNLFGNVIKISKTYLKI